MNYTMMQRLFAGLVLFTSAALGTLGAEMPDWFLSPPAAMDRVYGVGLGDTAFEAAVSAMVDLSFKMGTNFGQKSMNDSGLSASWMETEWKGHSFRLSGSYLTAGGPGSSGGSASAFHSVITLIILDEAAGEFMVYSLIAEQMDGGEKKRILRSGTLSESAALRTLDREERWWKGASRSERGGIRVLRLEDDAQGRDSGGSRIYYSLVSTLIEP